MYLIYYAENDTTTDIPKVLAVTNEKITVSDVLNKVAIDFIVCKHGKDRATTAFIAPQTEGMYLIPENSHSITVKQKLLNIVEGGWFVGESFIRTEKVIGYFRVVQADQSLNLSQSLSESVSFPLLSPIYKPPVTIPLENPWINELKEVISFKYKNE